MQKTENEPEFLRPADVMSRIKKGISGCFIFCGPEDYLIRSYIKSACDAVSGGDPTVEAFAVSHIDFREDSEDRKGGNINYNELLSAAESLPMFCDRRLVHVRGVNFGRMTADGLDRFCETAEGFSDNDALAVIFEASEEEIDAGQLPKHPSAVLKKLARHLSVAFFDTQPPAKLAAWTKKHFSVSGVTAQTTQCHQIIENCGGSMWLIASETDKLSAYVLSQGRRELLDSDISEAGSVASAEPKPFAVSNAILDGKRESLLSSYYEMKNKKVRPEIILSQISSVFCELQTVLGLSDAGEARSAIASALGMHEFRVGKYIEAGRRISREKICRAVELCGETDTLIKSFSQDPYTAIERLIALI